MPGFRNTTPKWISNNPPPMLGNITTSPNDMAGASWTGGAGGVTVTTDVAQAPDGTMTADLVVPTSLNTNNHGMTQINLTTTAVMWTLRVRAKPAGYNHMGILVTADSGFTSYIEMVYNLSGRVPRVSRQIGTYEPASYSVKRLPNGWFLCELQFKAAANSTHQATYKIYNNSENVISAYIGDTVSGMYVWGAEMAPS